MSAKKASGIASMLVGSAALAIITGKRVAAVQQPTTPRAPAPSALPRAPAKPAAPNQPAPPVPAPAASEFRFTAGRRYDITADVLPAKGVGLMSMATKALEHLQFEDASLKSYKDFQRPGFGEVTRVRFHATALAPNSVAFDRQMSVPAAGSVWLVSAREVES